MTFVRPIKILKLFKNIQVNPPLMMKSKYLTRKYKYIGFRNIWLPLCKNFFLILIFAPFLLILTFDSMITTNFESSFTTTLV